MPPAARKPRPAPAAPAAEEDNNTPIHDQLVKDLESADPEDVTLFEEDNDPLSNVGELVDEDDDESTEKENL